MRLEPLDTAEKKTDAFKFAMRGMKEGQFDLRFGSGRLRTCIHFDETCTSYFQLSYRHHLSTCLDLHMPLAWAI